MDEVVITLPLPPKSLHPNARPHHFKKARDTKSAREIAAMVARQHRSQDWPWGGASFQATFFLPRKNDDDNLAAWLKAYRDGIASAGVVVNDSRFVVLPVVQHTGNKNTGGRYRVVITLMRTG